MSSRWTTFPRGALIGLLLAGAVFASIWLPELAHWYVRPGAISESGLQAARKAPARQVLDEIAAMQLRPAESYPRQVVEAAELVMRGTLSLPGFPPTRVTLPFDPKDLSRGLPTWQLMGASLAAPDILLDAYRITRREPYFRQARDSIVAFARFESGRWIDHGFLWNDHAIAARVSVLVKFWAVYRDRPDFDPETGRTVLGLVARSALLLAKRSFYAWRTGHGILSDLAMMQIAAAFPELPESVTVRSVAVERFRNHLNYYVNREGVTLLHSAGYHSSGLHAFGIALRLFTLNGVEIPADWWERYARAVGFYALLRRPDGTLPMFGDTFSVSDGQGPPLTARSSGVGVAEPLSPRTAWPRAAVFALYPAAGHALWWDREEQPNAESIAQTVITWSYQPGLGHKLADELSMIVWARGRTWLTNAGYWPYGTPGRANAESWEASNAPHLFGESKGSERASRVRGVGEREGISFLDIERNGPSGYSVRRQIARIPGAGAWVVLDHSLDSAARTTTTNWNFYPDLEILQLSGQGRFRVLARDSRLMMLVSISGSEEIRTEPVFGQAAPFAGWVVMERTPVRAPAIVVRQPSRDSWSLAAFTFLDAAQEPGLAGGARMLDWRDQEHWSVAVPAASGEFRLIREGGRLVLRRPGIGQDDEPVAVTALDAPADELRSVGEAVRWAEQNYRKFAELYSYRARVSYLLLGVLIAQELMLLIVGQRLPRAARAMRVAGWIAWIAGGIWLSQAYFVVPR